MVVTPLEMNSCLLRQVKILSKHWDPALLYNRIAHVAIGKQFSGRHANACLQIFAKVKNPAQIILRPF
jgi:hypothetical protein